MREETEALPLIIAGAVFKPGSEHKAKALTSPHASLLV